MLRPGVYYCHVVSASLVIACHMGKPVSASGLLLQVRQIQLYVVPPTGAELVVYKLYSQ